MNQDELLREQIALLRQQNRVLLHMAAHTRLLYILAWISLVGAIVTTAAMAGSSGDGGSGIMVLVIGAIVIAAIVKHSKNVETMARAEGSAQIAD